jgi:hypothetical protein
MFWSYGNGTTRLGFGVWVKLVKTLHGFCIDILLGYGYGVKDLPHQFCASKTECSGV